MWEGVKVAMRTSVLGGEELGTRLGHRVTMSVLFIEQCGWVGIVGWEERKKKNNEHFR